MPTSDISQDPKITKKAESAPSAADILLHDLIDYAGLFPPASLGMNQALANYDTYSRSEWSWVLGRFVVPAARLEEFEQALGELPPANPASPAAELQLSVLLGADPVADVVRMNEFKARGARSGSKPAPVIESVELKVANADEIARFSAILPADLDVYFEFPLSSCAESIAAVAGCRRRAKIRTGGETADKIPRPESVIEFIRLCAAASVPFKATAGLHHPVRSAHRLTYQPDSPSGVMHGFLNVFLAAAFLRAGMHGDMALQVLEERSTETFRLGFDGIRWRDNQLGLDKLSAARANSAISFGSCSFTEPIDDLRSLHIL